MSLVFVIGGVLVIGSLAVSHWLAEKIASWFAIHILGGRAIIHGHIFAVRGSEYERQITFVKKAKKKQPTYYVQNLLLALVYFGTAIAVFQFVLPRLIALFAPYAILLMQGQSAQQIMDTYPFLQVGLGLLYLVVQVVWIVFFFRRVDPWLRQRIGERFGVTLQIGRRGLWTVVEKGQGMRGCLLELLQIIVWLPVVMLPLILFTGLMMLIASQT